ncbi:hypothetical protein D559_0002 [Bordetella holmesii 1058]|uniref:N-acetyltransferase YedL n=1 Tax=Bordetella holmesii 1058 TaxID=1247648 RepID=A0ABP3BRE8_9BORD|nr:hypothetical protein D559_0002 [Bordetella holmesii 1058]
MQPSTCVGQPIGNFIRTALRDLPREVQEFGRRAQDSMLGTSAVCRAPQARLATRRATRVTLTQAQHPWQGPSS